MVSNTTLNAGIVINYYNSCEEYESTPFPGELDGAQIYKWNRASQDWSSSIYLTSLGGWYPDLPIGPGDAIHVYYSDAAPTNSCDDWTIWQIGDIPEYDQVSIIIEPGLNLLAAPIKNTGFGLGIADYFYTDTWINNNPGPYPHPFCETSGYMNWGMGVGYINCVIPRAAQVWSYFGEVDPYQMEQFWETGGSDYRYWYGGMIEENGSGVPVWYELPDPDGIELDIAGRPPLVKPGFSFWYYNASGEEQEWKWGGLQSFD